MRDLSDGRTSIDHNDFASWCNCSNFPHQKCDECKWALGNLTQMNDGDVFILKP